MKQREITLWVDERWCKALEKYLLNITVAEKLEEHIDDLVNQLPQNVYEKISGEIWQEQQQDKLDAEASRRFAVLHVIENRKATYFIAEEHLETLQVAARLRNYIRKQPENSHSHFVGMFQRGEKISREQFEAYVSERLDNTGRVTGAFHIDLDRESFSALHIRDGWQSFHIQDISTAVYYAMKKTAASQELRWRVFLDRLNGKEIMNEFEPGYIAGKRMLRPDDIWITEDIIQNDNRLEFCLDAGIDVDGLFGSHVCDYDNGEWLNIYANYDMETRSVCDTLEVFMQYETGGEQDYKYRLSIEEKELLLPAMEAYCQKNLGMSLEECCQQYESEQHEYLQNNEMILS